MKLLHTAFASLSLRQSASVPCVLQKRYSFNNYEDLCHRVAKHAAMPNIRNKFCQAMLEKRFCPAGNTLLAGVRPIRPNCSILPTVTDANLEEILARARKLWRHHTGIGFDLSGTSNPAATLVTLMKECKQIEFNDRSQRGNMAVVDASHPRAVDFVMAKGDEQSAKAIYGFNISLAFSSDQQFASMLGRSRTDRSSLLWKAAESAWTTGCPGLAFLHRFQASKYERELDQLIPSLPPISTTVPCGEQGMRENESCNLGVLNLASPFHYDQSGKLCQRSLSETIRIAVRFLDGVVDQLQIDDSLMQAQTRQLRRIGLGVTGFADCLAQLNLRYDSPEARNFGSMLAKFVTDEADKESRKIASQKGSYMNGSERRNVTVTCCQPTGNITLLLGTNGFSIEPLMSEATRIHWSDHLAMQSAWQHHIENAVSKTVNLHQNSTVEDVMDVFKAAFEDKAIKGVAIYRDGSRQAQPISLQSNCPTCA